MLADVEAFMGRASKEMAYYNLPETEKPYLAYLNFDSNTILKSDFASNPILSGKTIRRGWVHSGKNAAYSGLGHIEHSHGE